MRKCKLACRPERHSSTPMNNHSNAIASPEHLLDDSLSLPLPAGDSHSPTERTSVPAMHLDSARADIVEIEANIRQSLDAIENVKMKVGSASTWSQEVTTLIKATFESNVDGIVVINAEQRIVAFNKSFSAIWGHPPFLRTGIIVWEFAEKAAECFLDLGTKTVDKLKNQFIHPDQIYQDDIHLKDGRCFSRTSTPQYKSTDWIGTVITWRDVTSLRRNEEDLRSQAKVHRTLIHGLQEGIALVSREHGIIEANAKAEEIAGQTLDQMRGQFCINSDWVAIHEDGSLVPEEKRVLQIAFRTSRAQLGSIHGFRKPNGEVVWLSLNATPLIEKDCDEVSFVVVSFTDVTSRKQADARRAELEAQLRASQKMESLGTLAGGIAHDFNNILSAILGNVAIAQSNLNIPREMEISLNEIDVAANRAKQLVRKILAFSRQSSHAPTVQTLKPLIIEALGILKASIPAGIKIEFESGPEELCASVDATELSQVVLNLCTNAWQAVLDRKGVIKVSLARVDVAAEIVETNCSLPTGQYIRLRVSDNGCGMTQDTVGRIFEPFFTTKNVDQGTGLGLSVVHGIVMKHGGCIKVDSKLGRGTNMDVFLPLAHLPLTADTPSNAKNIAIDDSLPRCAIYVDDEESMVYMVERYLKLRGFSVSGFTNPKTALAEYRKMPKRYDILVTDQNMPNMSGIELAKAVKSIDPTLPIVITSGYIDDNLRRQAKAIGIDRVLYKPNTVQELCETISEMTEIS